MVGFWVDGKHCAAPADLTVLQAAAQSGFYIPALCFHPGMPSSVQTTGGDCGLCVIEVEGEPGLQKACMLPVKPGLRVATNSAVLQSARQDALARILEHHPHVCLTCPQRDGCSRVMCCFNNKVEERCCSIMSHCELRKVADYVVIPDSTPEYDPACNRLPIVKDGPFYDLDYNLCIDCRRCLVACNEVRGVACLEVKNTNGRTWVGPIAETLIESGCKFCNACVEVCPTGALLDRTITAQQRQAESAPCTQACPAGIDVPRYVQLAGLGRFAQANAVVREKLPFPGILGRACYAPCESDCRRGNLDDPLSIRSLKRIAAEHDDGRWRALQRREKPTGRRVAVIGAGPAGLTAAFYLAKKGHDLTVFEAQSKAGGMARYGIPAYRLPREIIENEVAEVAALGVSFRFNEWVADPMRLLAQGFEAVFIATGAQKGLRPDVEGAGLPGVVDGIDFLRDVAEGRMVTLSGSVTVVGGGDVACDAARSALRLTDDEVALIYRRSQEEMSAQAGELEDLLLEGGRASFQHQPQHIRLDENGTIEVIWKKTRKSRPDALGRRHLETVPESESKSPTSLLIMATGQQGQPLSGVELDDRGRILVGPDGKLNGKKGLFAGGDIVTGPSSLIEAVAQGRQAASTMDIYLGGDGDIEETLLDAEEGDRQTAPWFGREEGFNQRRLVLPPRRAPVSGQRPGWEEIESVYPAKAAMAEGQRCLKCNTIHEIRGNGPFLPPESWRRFEARQVHATPTESGVYFLLDASKQIIDIKGVPHLQQALVDLLTRDEGAKIYFFDIEIAHFYSQRESELLQAFSEQHGRLPPGIGNEGLDDLF